MKIVPDKGHSRCDLLPANARYLRDSPKKWLRDNLEAIYDVMSLHMTAWLADPPLAVHCVRYRGRMRCLNDFATGIKIVILFWCGSWNSAVAEDSSRITNENETESIDAKEATEEWYFVLVFSLLFGFIVTIFGAAIGYFSFKEDRLMNRYKKEGYAVYADIVIADLVRGDHTKKSEAELTEYLVTVDYYHDLAENYTVRVRKQLKARYGDFVHVHELPSNKECILVDMKGLEVGPMKGSEEKDKNMNEGKQSTLEETLSTAPHSAEKTASDPNNDVLMHGSGINIALDALELYVLPEFPKSGYPKAQADRICSTRYRCSTILLVIVNFMIAAFCTYFAVQSTLGADEATQKSAVRFSIGFYIFLVIIEIPCVYYCLDNLFEGALKDEYLENGEFLPCCDESTISSGNDTHLVLTRAFTPELLWSSSLISV